MEELSDTILKWDSVSEFLKSVGWADKNMLGSTKIDSLSVRRTGKEFPWQHFLASVLPQV
jgi:hypothetical protein